MLQRILGTLRAVLEHRFLPLALAAIAVLLTAGSLRIGWMFDDEVHRAAFSAPPEIAELERPFWDLFAFLGDRWQPQSDFLPWWANESITVAFFRPVTGLTHWLDHQLWPTHAGAMHLHNLLWFAAVIWIATRLYGALPGWRHTWMAGLAALLFALDDAHSSPAVWIASRNALLGFFFGGCALWIHHRARLRQRTWGSPLAPLFVLLALLSAEASIAWGAYLASYALLLDRGELKSRIASLLPTAATATTWFVVYRLLGYGLQEQRLYVDPFADLGHLIATVLQRAPVLLWGQFAFPPADFHNYLSAPLAKQASLGAALALLLGVLLMWPLLRTQRTVRFWILGTGLAVLPSCLTYPTQRLLVIVSLGGAAIVAIVLHHAWSPLAAISTRGARVHRWVLRLVSLPLLFVHLVQAPLGLATAAYFHGLAADRFGAYSESLPSEPDVTRRDVVIVQAISFFPVAFGPIHQALRGQSIPRTTTVLASGLETVEVWRPDPSSLVLRPANGFFPPPGTAPPGDTPAAFDMMYMFQVSDAMFSDGRPFAVGEKRTHGPFELEVLGLTDDHRPAEVRFLFQTPLEDSSLVWLGWGPEGFVPWELPGVGERLTLPAVRF